MPYKKSMRNLLLVMFTSIIFTTPSTAVQSINPDVYPDLKGLLSHTSSPESFMAFTGFLDHDEETVKKAGREYFNTHPELVQRIRNDLGSQEVEWQLTDLSHRLLYAPETRMAVAGLFTSYCQETIEDLLLRTGFDNPYSSIAPLYNTPTDVNDDKGIQAFIVQDLAMEYNAQYQFTGSSSRKIEIDLAGHITINEVGSYSSYLESSKKNNTLAFTRDQYTIWKSSSANPYTVLMTPLEETLHIVLRKYTEKAIIDAIGNQDKLPIEIIKELIEDWLAVEEAIVGGLVYKLVPDVVISRIPDLPTDWIQADLKTKARFNKYRFLPKGIEVVENKGLKETIKIYSQSPLAFRKLLTKTNDRNDKPSPT